MTDVVEVESRTFRRAVRVALLDLLGAVLVATVAVIATVASGLEVHPGLVVLIGAGLAVEQLWRRRDHVPVEVPKVEVQEGEVDESPLRPWRDLGVALGIAVALFAVGLLLADGGGNVLIGFAAAYVTRELATLVWVAGWERRHGRRLLWHEDLDGVRAGVLAKA